MCHIANLPDALARGLFSCRHAQFTPPAVRIGDLALAEFRDNYQLKAPASGTIGEYVAFYLGAQSPMLHRIRTGWNVPQAHPQRDVVYILVRCTDVLNAGLRYVVTDGQANQAVTKHYVDEKGLELVDWNAVHALDWKNTEQDRDRMRKKQAEFLIHESLTRDLIAAIGVYDDARKTEVETLVSALGLTIPVKVDRQRKLYYP